MNLQDRLRLVRRLAVSVVAWTFVLMVLGSWVKATGSGLSCPDWPQCYGEWLPPFPSAENGGTWEGAPVPYTQAQVLYEWTHRLVAATLGVPLLAFAWLAFRTKELSRPLRTLPVAAVAIVFVQAGLGGGTVLKGNPAWLTTAHLATATLIFGLLVAAACFAFLRPLPGTAPRPAAPPAPPEPPKAWGYVYSEEPQAEEPRDG